MRFQMDIKFERQISTQSIVHVEKNYKGLKTIINLCSGQATNKN